MDEVDELERLLSDLSPFLPGGTSLVTGGADDDLDCLLSQLPSIVKLADPPSTSQPMVRSSISPPRPVPRPSVTLCRHFALRYAAWPADSFISLLPRALLGCVHDYLPVVEASDLANRSAVTFVNGAIVSAAQVRCELTIRMEGTDLKARLARAHTNGRGYTVLDVSGWLSVDVTTPFTLNFELTGGGDARFDALRGTGVGGACMYQGMKMRPRAEFVWPDSAAQPLAVRLWMYAASVLEAPVCMTLVLDFDPHRWRGGVWV